MKALLDAVLVDLDATLLAKVTANSGGRDHTPANAPRLRPGVADDLAWLRGTIAVGALVNASGRDQTEAHEVLASLGIDEALDVVITGCGAGEVPPDPKLILLAIDELGIDDPARVLVVGDAPELAEAAANAGANYVPLSGLTGDENNTIRDVVDAWVRRMAGHRFEAARAKIVRADVRAGNEASAAHAELTSPQGSLGQVERIGAQLASIAGTSPPPVPEPATIAVFAADHGIVDSGVTPWSQEATAQMVNQFTSGGSAINVLARHAGAGVVVVDVGLAPTLPVHDHPLLIRRSVRPGTANLAVGPAMSRQDALRALDVGVEIAEYAVKAGYRCLITGDMGIGNTTAASAIIAGITNTAAEEVVTGDAESDVEIDEVVAREIAVIDAAMDELSSTVGPLTLLEQVGGLEIAAMAGFIVGAAANRVPVIIDGLTANAALLLANQLAPDVTDYVIAGHRSNEPAANAALEFVGLEPLLDLDLSLGEGTGAALALPVVQAAAKLLREMESFEGPNGTSSNN